jgi:putrescine transport system ATP-binding protein
LLDEPLAALDKRLREQTQFELMRIQDEVGITFIVVTHDQEEAMTLATRIGVMNAGSIVQTGTPREIYEAPANRFVADFVGSVNLFEGRVTRQTDGVVWLDVADVPGGLKVCHDQPLPVGSACAVALRPEKLQITRDDPGATADNRLHGTVVEIGYLGASCIFRIRTEAGRKIQVMQPNRSRDLSLAYQWDEPVWVSWSTESGVVVLG